MPLIEIYWKQLAKNQSPTFSSAFIFDEGSFHLS